jgi:hypothetical protein
LRHAFSTGLTSKATRLMFIKCSGEILSEVTFPPQEPQPKVREGASAVERPMVPWVVRVLIVVRETGIVLPKATAVLRERVCMPAVWPLPP